MLTLCQGEGGKHNPGGGINRFLPPELHNLPVFVFKVLFDSFSFKKKNGCPSKKAGDKLRQALRQLGMATAGEVHTVNLVELATPGIHEVGSHQLGGLLIE